MAGAPAEGKGGGFRFDGYLWPGRVVQDRASLKGVSPMVLDRGPFHARAVAVLHSLSWGPYATMPSTREAYLGPVVVDGDRATLRFRVPNLAPGSYALRVCNSPCTTRLRSLEGFTLNIARNSTQASLHHGLDRVDERVSNANFRMRELCERLDDFEIRSGLAAQELREQSTRLEELVDRVRAGDDGSPSIEGGAMVPLLIAAGGVFGFLLGWRWAGFQRRRELPGDRSSPTALQG